MSFYRPTWVQISTSTFARNLKSLKSFVGPRVDLLAVLKANAYGHGAVDLAPVALRSGARSIGVSSLEEAIELREAHIQAPILILGGMYPLKNFDVALRYQLTPTVASFESARAFVSACQKRGRFVPFQLKVDTGMGRIGVSVSEARRLLGWLSSFRVRILGGVYSHLSSADSDANFTRHQISQLRSLRNESEALGFRNVSFHIANSAGLLRFQTSHFDAVRPGLSLYGLSPVSVPMKVKLSPVLSWQTQIIFLKKVKKGTPISYSQSFLTQRTTRVATCPVGYADGLPRQASNRGHVLVKGHRCPILGRVTMDHIMIDVTGLKVDVGESVMLLGSQGAHSLTAHDWARWAGTIPYEIFCGLSERVPRISVK